MSWYQTILVTPLLLALPVAPILLIYLYRRQGLHEFPLMLLISAAAIWATGYGCELVLPTFELKLKVVTFEYIGIVLVPVGWLALGLQLHDQLHRIKPWSIPLLLVIPAATLIQVMTWQSHDFFWRTKEVVQYGPLTLISNTYGLGFWIHIVYSYGLQLAGGILILASIFGSNDFYIRQRISLALALILPWTANIFYIFKIQSVPIDFTPLSAVISSILIVVGVFRYRLGDLAPLARKKVISEMREGVMIFDNRNRLIDVNPAAITLFGFNRPVIGVSAVELLAGHPELLDLFDPARESDELLYSSFPGRVVRVTGEALHSMGRRPCRLLVFHDLSLGNNMETTLRLVVEGTSADTGEDFFRSLTRSLALALGSRYALIALLEEPDKTHLQTLAFWDRDKFLHNFAYDIGNTPCEDLTRQRTRIIPANVRQQFPENTMLADLDVESYIGTRLTGFDQTPIGVLVVMNDKPFEYEEVLASVLEVFAIRASSELERRRVDMKLEESEARYRRMVETTRDGVCIVNREGNIEFLNEPMAAMIGGNKDALLGRNLWSQFHVDDTNRDEFSTFDNDTIELRLVRSDGRKISAAISKTVIYDPDGNVSGMLTMFTDVTESRLLEEHSTRMELQLQHAQKLESLGVLAGGIAHDFNNLLMPILGYLDLIQDRVRNDSMVVEYLNRMRDAGGKLADLCNQMLTYSGRGQFIKKALDLNQSLGRLGDLMRASTARHVDIEYRLAPHLSSIKVDETQLDQIVINLIINASEAMSEQSFGKITVRTGEDSLDAEALKGLHNGESIEPGNFVYLEVSDEGTGIAERDISRLFEPFFTTKFTGRGLGMAVVFGIVKGHRGAIRVISEPGVGTWIRIYFPTSDEAVVHLEQRFPSSRTSSAMGLIMVVDDEEMVRTIVSRMLESVGYKVITANNGRLGYDAYLEHQEALVGCVVDVTMPELDGYSLVRHIQNHGSEFPIVMVSGYHIREFEDRDIDRTNVTFLQKPFEVEQLLAALDTTDTDIAANQIPPG